MPAKGQRIDKTTGKLMPTVKQQRAFELRVKFPEKSLYECLVLAGYSANTAIDGRGNFLESAGVKSMQELYGYELAR